ncbi:hypothetical protein F4777DRAFT_599342 [Nemania sp. FL0916]|nr:hypothetical protein F4777DRAFT_599342 [Nemania sp. FL0916]
MASYQYERAGDDTNYPEVAFDSGLEVVQSPHPTHTPSQYRYDEYPELVSSPTGVNSTPKLKSEYPTETASTTERIYCFGWSRRVLWTVIGLLILVVVATLAGGLAGGLSHRSSSSNADKDMPPPPPPSPPPPGNSTPTPGPFLNSQLAAVNWTDGANQLRRAVFYQSVGSLLASVSHGPDNASTWTQVNISALFDQDTDWAPPRNSSPISASAVPYQGSKFEFSVSLFYLDENNLLRHLYSNDGDYDLKGWQYEPEWLGAYAAAEDSRLTSVAYYCPTGCPNNVCVVYQDGERSVWFTCGSDWSLRTAVVRAIPGSPLAIIPSTYGNSSSVIVNELRFFAYSDTDIKGLLYNHGGDGDFDPDPLDIVESLSDTVSTLPQVVACPFNSLVNIMVLVLEEDGQVIESWWNGEVDFKWNINNRASFNNEDGSNTQSVAKFNMSVIALDHNHRLYGLAADGSSIVQYTWSDDAPTVFNYTAVVVSK